MYLVVLMNSHIARTWMLFLYALSPNESVADVLNQVSNILFSKLCGFFIAATIIVRGWKWVFHISWFSYALRALANNDLVRDGGVQRACTPTPEVECRFQNGAEALELYYVRIIINAHTARLQTFGKKEFVSHPTLIHLDFVWNVLRSGNGHVHRCLGRCVGPVVFLLGVQLRCRRDAGLGRLEPDGQT
jgi:hypothetical protein